MSKLPNFVYGHEESPEIDPDRDLEPPATPEERRRRSQEALRDSVLGEDEEEEDG